MKTTRIIPGLVLAAIIVLSCLNLSIQKNQLSSTVDNLTSLKLSIVQNNAFASADYGMHCRGCGSVFTNRSMTCCLCAGRIEFFNLNCNVCYCDEGGGGTDVLEIIMCC